MQKLSRSLIALGGLAALAACGDDVSIASPTPIPAAVVGVTVSPASLTLKVGESATLGVSVETTGGAGSGVTWTSSTPAVATVSATGAVTAVAAGNTTVRATSTVDNTKSGAAQVTVTAPVVRSVTVTPSALALTVGQTGNAVATVDRDAPLAGTVTWASSATSVATVSTAGVITAVAAGNAVITATSTADPTKLAALAVTVSAIPNNLLSLNVAPASVNVGPGATQQLTATVNTVGSPTVTYTYTSGNAGVATVSSTGLVTGVAQGTTVITVSAATNTNTLTTSVTVNVSAASVSIASLTTSASGTTVPVNLAGVAGQIEATLNINSGAQQISKVDVLIDNIVAATQNFGVNGAPNAPVTLSINTAEFDANYVAKWINGPRTISAKITPANGGTPTASNSIQFTLANVDVVYFNASGLTHTGNSATGANGTWWKGGFTYSSFPVSYSGQIASIGYSSSACGSASGTVAPTYVATFSCSGVESAQSIGSGLAVTYNAGYTLTSAPAFFVFPCTAPGVPLNCTAAYVPGKPVYAAVSTNEDNVGPSASGVTFANGLTNVASDWWAGSPTTWSATWSDVGVGMTASSASSAAQTDVSNNGGTSWGFPNINNPTTLAETLTGSGYIASAAPGTDLLGNVGSRGGSSVSYGVDLVVLDAQYADRAVAPGLTALQVFPLTANGTIYGEVPGGNAEWTTTRDGGTEQVGVDAIDTRSGLDNVNAQVSSLVRRTASGSTSCASGATNLSFILSDNYVQTSTPAQLDCGLLAGSRVGYYTWTASVKDRAQNSKKITDGSAVVDSVYMAIDEAAPNITGIGFQTTLYTGGAAATFSFSANDDLELKDGQVQLKYGYGAAATDTIQVIYPYGSSAYTSAAFGAPFDATFSNVINGASLTLGYFVTNWDFVTATVFAPAGTGNVSGFTSSAIPNGVTANVRDVANQSAAVPLVAPMLSTQITASAAPSYTSSMVHWAITNNTGGVLTIRHTGLTSSTLTFCERIDIYEANAGAAAGPVKAATTTDLTYRATISGSPVITDNGINRFWTYTSSALTNLNTGNYTAACVKGGRALLSDLI